MRIKSLLYLDTVLSAPDLVVEKSILNVYRSYSKFYKIL